MAVASLATGAIDQIALSAATLEAALRDRGRVHGMSEAATRLTTAQLADLIAFLDTR